MIVGLGVAQLYHRLAGLGDAHFDVEHGFHFLLGRGFVVTHEAEHLDDILLVGLANLLRGFVVLQIVVAVAQREAALLDAYDVHLAVFHVGAYADAEVRLYAVAAELSRQNGQIFQRFHGSYLLQLSLDGRPALAVAAGAVHGQVV